MTVTGSFWMGVENTVILSQFGGSRIPEIEGEIGGAGKSFVRWLPQSRISVSRALIPELSPSTPNRSRRM